MIYLGQRHNHFFMQLPLPPDVRELFAPLDEQLIGLLSVLSEAEWQQPTIARKWCVKDIAAHLLDGNIRALSMSRDGYFGETPSNDDLLGFLNALNADWVKAMKRTSPAVLVSLLRITGKMVSEHYASLDPAATAIFPVAWAGENVSSNRMHLAREYTEKFIHQQQIRHALNRPGLLVKKWYYPFIATFMMALPFAYRHTHAAEGTVVKVVISGECGGEWMIVRQSAGWHFTTEGSPAATVTIDADTAWQLFSKGITPAEAVATTIIEGDTTLGSVALHMVSVMA